jgi:hypothetical protein
VKVEEENICSNHDDFPIRIISLRTKRKSKIRIKAEVEVRLLEFMDNLSLLFLPSKPNSASSQCIYPSNHND